MELPSTPPYVYTDEWCLVKQRNNFRATIILSIVLHGCGTRPVTLTENRLRTLENKVVRKIFGP